MSRRAFLSKSSAFVIGGSTAVLAPAALAQTENVRWRCASSFPKSVDTLFGTAELITRRVAQITAGKFQISMHAAGEIVPPLQVLDAVEKGTIECNHTAPYYFIGKDPAWAFGTCIPFGLNSRQHNAWWIHGDGEKVFNEFSRQFGVVNLLAGNTGAQMAGWFKKEIKGAVLQGPARNVIALDWDQHVSIKGKTQNLDLHFLAVQHWSARSLGDRYETLWGSWAFMHPDLRFWFSGDLAYSPDTKAIGERMGGFDLAAIAIGAYEPRWFMKDSHLNPQEALQVMREVNAKAAIGIHWGTFDGMSDEPLDQPPKDLEIAKNESSSPLNFFVLKHGESWVWR